MGEGQQPGLKGIMRPKLEWDLSLANRNSEISDSQGKNVLSKLVTLGSATALSREQLLLGYSVSPA